MGELIPIKLGPNHTLLCIYFNNMWKKTLLTHRKFKLLLTHPRFYLLGHTHKYCYCLCLASLMWTTEHACLQNNNNTPIHCVFSSYLHGSSLQIESWTSSWHSSKHFQTHDWSIKYSVRRTTTAFGANVRALLRHKINCTQHTQCTHTLVYAWNILKVVQRNGFFFVCALLPYTLISWHPHKIIWEPIFYWYSNINEKNLNETVI